MAEAPDFEALRRRRNESVRDSMMTIAREMGWKEGDEPPTTSYDFGACYCACASHGPCEHDFQGWREFEDGLGGETFCSRCGMGAMGHSMRIGI